MQADNLITDNNPHEQKNAVWPQYQKAELAGPKVKTKNLFSFLKPTDLLQKPFSKAVNIKQTPLNLEGQLKLFPLITNRKRWGTQGTNSIAVTN